MSTTGRTKPERSSSHYRLITMRTASGEILRHPPFRLNFELPTVLDKAPMIALQVGDALLETIFDPSADSAGLVIDGFPRTAFQVELLKLLYDKMMSLHVLYADRADEWRYPRPSFKVRQ